MRAMSGFSYLIAAVSILTPSFVVAQNGAPEEEAETAASALDLLFGTSNLEIDWAEVDKHPLGGEANPVRCDMPPGERAYLSRLRCPNNIAPKFSRAGSVGIGPFGHIMDLYYVHCDGEEAKAVFMDMYFPGYIENRPVPGFAIVAAE